jgi:hypothetical protein
VNQTFLRKRLIDLADREDSGKMKVTDSRGTGNALE